MTAASHFTHRSETQDDGSILHIFEGTSMEPDWASLDEFCSTHNMRFNSFGTGFDGVHGFEDVEIFTDSLTVALLFKLTFGGSQ